MAVGTNERLHIIRRYEQNEEIKMSMSMKKHFCISLILCSSNRVAEYVLLLRDNINTCTYLGAQRPLFAEVLLDPPLSGSCFILS